MPGSHARPRPVAPPSPLHSGRQAVGVGGQARGAPAATSLGSEPSLCQQDPVARKVDGSPVLIMDYKLECREARWLASRGLSGASGPTRSL